MSVFIIAEIGVNFQGNLELAKRLIYSAKESGADAVKFQLYDPAKIFGPEGSHPDGKNYQWALKCELSRDTFIELWRFAELVNIPLSASVFDFERFHWLAELNPPFYKIASRTAQTDPDLTWAVIETGKPIYISNGFGWAENYRTAPNVREMFCVSQYPALKVDLPEFGGINGRPHGYSDHFPGTRKALEAINRGAMSLEVHYTFDHKMEGPDHVMSKTPDELRQIVKEVKRNGR